MTYVKVIEIDLLEERYTSLKNNFNRFGVLMGNSLLETKGELLWCLNELRSGVRRVTESIHEIENDNIKITKDRKKLIKKAQVLCNKVTFLIDSPEVKERIGDQYFTFRPMRKAISTVIPVTDTPTLGVIPVNPVPAPIHSNLFNMVTVPVIPSVNPPENLESVVKIVTEDKPEEHFDDISILDKEPNVKEQLDSKLHLDSKDEGKEGIDDDQEMFLKTSDNDEGKGKGKGKGKEKHRKNIRMNNFKIKVLNGLAWMKKNPKRVAIIVATTVGVIIILAIIL